MSISKTKPLVSILMNCYNGERYLKEAIDSVVNQSYTNWELIFWDNQSTDKSADIVKSYDDVRIKYHYAPRFTQLNLARIGAYEYLRGELVAILDADDVAHPTRLEKQVDCFSNDLNLALVGTFAEYIDENSKVFKSHTSVTLDEDIKHKLWYKNIFIHSSLMYRKMVFDNLGGYSDKFIYSQDYDLALKMSRDHRVMVIKEYLCKYRVSSTSMTGSRKFKLTDCKECIYHCRNAHSYLKINMYSYLMNRFYLLKYFLKYLLITLKLY